jgi:hypothetical protein
LLLGYLPRPLYLAASFILGAGYQNYRPNEAALAFAFLVTVCFRTYRPNLKIAVAGFDYFGISSNVREIVYPMKKPDNNKVAQ